jgi:hypothetical protein
VPPRHDLRSSPGRGDADSCIYLVCWFNRARLVNGCQRQTPCQTGGCGPTVHPCQGKCNQCEREILRGRDESTVLGVDEDGIAIPMMCRRVVGAEGDGQFELSFLRPNLPATGTVSYRMSYAAQSGRTGPPSTPVSLPPQPYCRPPRHFSRG